MNKLEAFLESGILEMYVMGNTSSSENAEVEHMASLYNEVQTEIEAIESALKQYAFSNAIEPPLTVKPFLMATISYMERLAGGEVPAFPPPVTKQSKISDYDLWLTRPDLMLDSPLDKFHAHIIGYTPERITAIVWLEKGAPPEVHKDEYESFLILEGSCNIVVGETEHHLYPGDVFSIPLYLSHHVIITSGTPCKVILERRAA